MRPATRILRAVRQPIRPVYPTTRAFSRPLTSSPGPTPPTPWFVDPEEDQTQTFTRLASPPHLSQQHPLNPLPDGIPEPVRVLYNELSTAPFLEPSTLVARKPMEIPIGPPLPARNPRGKRRRGRRTWIVKQVTPMTQSRPPPPRSW